MTHNAVAYRTIETPGQGRELKTDGYHNHIGGMDIGSLRVRSRAGHPSLTGAGVETIYIPPGGGVIQVYDRDVQAYQDLNIAGHNITLSPQSGGSLVLPANCIGTNQIQANAATGPTASFAAAVSFSTTSTSAWTNTPVTLSHTSAGQGPLRMEWAMDFQHSANGAGYQVAIAIDGNTQIGLATVNVQANWVTHLSGIWYCPPIGAGAHTWTLQVNNLTAGTLSAYAGTAAFLYVTEQKR